MATQRQLAERSTAIGASDVPAILGVDPWKTSYDVYLHKTQQFDKADKESPHLRAGTLFERALLDEAESRLGKLRRNQNRRSGSLPPLRSLIDAIHLDSGCPVEAKTSGLFGPLAEDWGKDGTDQVPDRVVVQTHAEMMALDNGERSVQEAHVAAFLGGIGFRFYVVRRSQKLSETITERVWAFWERVQTKIPPTDSMPSVSVMKMMRREPDKTVVADDENLLANWQSSKTVSKAARDDDRDVQASILKEMGDAEALVIPEKGTFTYLKTLRKGYTVDPKMFRTLRWKPFKRTVKELTHD